jgi:hypothetical protein
LDLVLLLLVQDRRLLLLLLLLLHHDAGRVTAAVSGPHPGLLLLLLLLLRWPSVRNVMTRLHDDKGGNDETKDNDDFRNDSFLLECLDAKWMRSCGINMPPS